MGAPVAFVSYSWDDDAHREWVKQLAARLRTDGVDAVLDQWHAVPGDQLPAFMEAAVRESSFVLMICTPRYKSKSDDRKGGVGYEGDIVTGEVLTAGNQRKFIPVLRRGDWKDAAPTWALGKYHIRLDADPYSEAAYRELVDTLLGRRELPPPLGAPATATASADRTVVELAAILDVLFNEIKSIQFIGYTFGESRRVLSFVKHLEHLLTARVAEAELVVSPSVLKQLKGLRDVLGQYTSEANYVLPHPGADKYTGSTDRFKVHRYNFLTGWIELKPRLLIDAQRRAEFEKLRNHDALWQLMGYRSEQAYLDYVSPKTQSMLAAANPIEAALFSFIADKGKVTEADLVADGFPLATVGEVLNALMRDKYVHSVDHKAFRLTKVGSAVLKDLLAKK